MKKLTPRETRLFGLTVLIGFILFNYLVVWDWVGGALERHTTVRNLKAEGELQKEVIARTAEWQSELKSLSKNADLAGPESNDTDWLRRLETKAKNSGLTLTSQKPVAERKTAFGTEAGVNYSIESTHGALVKFLHSLQDDPARPQIQMLQITPENPSTDKLRVEATIMITRYKL